MEYFDLRYPNDPNDPNDHNDSNNIISFESFYENLERHKFIHLISYDNSFDINEHISDIITIFDDTKINIDQIMFHTPNIPSEYIEKITVNGIDIVKKLPFLADLNNLNRIHDKIKYTLQPQFRKKCDRYNDIDFMRYADRDLEYTYPQFQMAPSIIKTESIIKFAELFYKIFFNYSFSGIEERFLSHQLDMSGFNSCYLCHSHTYQRHSLWNPQNNIDTAYVNNMTIVTGFFNLKTQKIHKRSCQIYEYLEQSKYTLSLRQNMVIFLSEDEIQYVTDYRESIGLSNMTKIIKIDENDLYMIDQYEKLVEITSKNIPPYNNPKYIMAVNSRYKYMEKAINSNYFNTDYYSWIDFSGGHIIDFSKKQYITYNKKNTVRICWIARYKTKKGFTYNHQVLGGGLFIAHKNTMKKYCELHNTEFTNLMNKGIIINDDKLCFFIFEKYPELFDIYFSSYKDMLTKS
jgi:hypothetical protein